MTPPSTVPAGARTWRVGTLTYSLAGIVMLFTWLLLGDFSYMMRERSAAPVTQLMLKKYAASDFITGIFLLTVPWAVILFLGPAISYWSDHHRGRWGRRIPFLLVPTPFVTLAMLGLAFSPSIGRRLHAATGGAPEHLNSTILLVMGVCWTVFEIGVVTANSVFNGLINDVVPRELLGRFYGLFRALGLGVGILFNYKIIGHAEEHYTIILASIGLIYGVGMTVMSLRVKEGGYPSPPPAVAPRRSAVLGALRDYWRDCFLRPYYLLVFLFLGVANLAFVPVNLFSIYAAKGYAMSMETYGRYLVVTYLCSFVVAFPLGWLADRLHPLRVAIGAAVLYGVAMAAGFLWMRDAASFGWAFLAHGVLSGAFFTGAAALPQMLFPREKFAQFAAAAGLLAALFNMALGPLVGAWLDHLGNQYRYTFLAGSVLAALSAVLGLWLHARWLRLGGRQGYVAPE
jgi:MFS family permease